MELVLRIIDFKIFCTFAVTLQNQSVSTLDLAKMVCIRKSLMCLLVVTSLGTCNAMANLSTTFGLTAGMPISQLSGCETGRDRIPWVYICKTAQVPLPDSRFQAYTINYTDKSGICSVIATANVDTRESADSLTKAYDAIKAEIDVAHGASKRYLWGVTQDYFKDHRQFMAKHGGSASGASIGVDQWSGLQMSSSDQKVYSVEASVRAIDVNQATINIAIKFDNIGTCFPSHRTYSFLAPVVKKGEKHFILGEGRELSACQALLAGVNTVMGGA